jgi:hypothetical protein
MKVIRVLLLGKQGLREIQRLIHPHAHIAVKVNEKVMPNRVVEAVWGFMAAYVLVFAVMVLLLMASGLDQVTSFSAVAGTLNNSGAGTRRSRAELLQYQRLQQVGSGLLDAAGPAGDLHRAGAAFPGLLASLKPLPRRLSEAVPAGVC